MSSQLSLFSDGSGDKKLKELFRALDSDFARWKKLHEEGGSDPNYADGVNLNLVRNHILHDRQEIAEYCREKGLTAPAGLDDYPVPEEVDNNYMARPDIIWAEARKTLDGLLRDENYIELMTLDLSEADKPAKQRVEACLGYVKRLEQAIDKGDLVYMRLYREDKAGMYHDAMRECLEAFEKTRTNMTHGPGM